MAMGQPYWGQFTAESILNTLANSPYLLPSFNIEYNPAVALGDPLNIGFGSIYIYNSAITVQNPPSFNSGPCAGTGLSCINEY
jgi:hypothetical protein